MHADGNPFPWRHTHTHGCTTTPFQIDLDPSLLQCELCKSGGASFQISIRPS